MDRDRRRHKATQTVLNRKITEDVARCEQNEHTKLLRIAVGPFTPTGLNGHKWRRAAAPFAYIDVDIDVENFLGCAKLWRHNITPLATYARLLPSDAIMRAKKRAREVILTLLLVGRRAGWPWAPLEIWLRILGEINEEECDL